MIFRSLLLLVGCMALSALPVRGQDIPTVPGLAPELLARIQSAHLAFCPHSRIVEVMPTIPIALRQREAWHELRAADYDANTYVPPVSGLEAILAKAGPRTATILVEYEGFPANAQAAFQLAVDIWERHIASTVPIRVIARWRPLGEGVLGSAGTTQIYANSPQMAMRDTWYPVALAEALVGQELNGTNPDIQANFNSTFTNWHFSLTTQTPPGQFDFATVVLHEIGHGLGFLSSFRVNTPESGGCDGPVGTGCWGFAGTNVVFPIVYDRYVEDASRVSLLNGNEYPSPTGRLGGGLTSNAVFFGGPQVRAVGDDQSQPLFAPSPWQGGSSLSHWNETTFRPGDPNSLMTPFLARGERILSPGPLTCAMFADMGWPMGADCLSFLNAAILAFEATRNGDNIEIRLGSGATRVSRFVIEQKYFNEPYREVSTLNDSGRDRDEYAVNLSGLRPGTYTFRAVAVLPDGSRQTSQEAEVRIPLNGAYLMDIYPNPLRPTSILHLQVARTDVVRSILYDALGREVVRLIDGRVSLGTRISRNLGNLGLSAGVYFLHTESDQFTEVRQIVVY